jgi:hypothetical protein
MLGLILGLIFLSLLYWVAGADGAASPK